MPDRTVEKPAESERIVVEKQAAEGVALVTLNRPQVLNALDYATLGELVDALERLDGDESVRCVVITGAGDRASRRWRTPRRSRCRLRTTLRGGSG